MPHVDIKCFPRDLNDEQKSALAADITEVIIRHLQSKDSSVSVALNEIEPEAWQGVWDVEIAPQMARLIKNLATVCETERAIKAPVLSSHYSVAVMTFPLETNVPAPR